MPGPAPKTPTTRQRRNRSATQAILPAETALREAPPKLPKHPDHPTSKWHPMTKRWWTDVWGSPMEAEFIRADEHGLFRLAVLIDFFWHKPTTALAAEIRLQQQSFGLTPLDRRRLEWSVAQAEEAKDKHHLRRSKRAAVVSGSDPRGVLE